MMFIIALTGATPSGYMLDVSDTGALTVRICSSAGDARYIGLDPRTGEHLPLEEEQDEPASSEPPCPWSTSADDNALLPSTTTQLFGYHRLSPSARNYTVNKQIHSGAAHARAPPVRA